jgi:hypothetical protein
MFETRKWSYHEVMIAMHQEELHELATELSQTAPGLLDFLKSYHEARKQVEQKLTDAERQEYKVMAKEWLEKRLLPLMQWRYVHRNDSNGLENLISLHQRDEQKWGPSH